MISWGSYGAYQVNQGVSYLPTYSNLKEVSIDPYLALRNAYLQSYDYGIAKILERDLAAVNNEINSDAAVLGVLGMDSDDVVSKSGTPTQPVNTSIDNVVKNETSTDKILKTGDNSEQLIDSAYKGYYSNDKNSALYIGSGYNSTGEGIVSKFHAAQDALPGNATTAQDAIQSVREQE
jgi:phospholipid-binding lipoprotein MlaA